LFTNDQLKETELTVRSKLIRRETIKLSKANGGYHYGGSFSVTEILINLYDSVLCEKDKFILSKGHACWPQYVLLREKGLNPKLEGHPHRDEKNGIICTTGSEGHGFPTGIGMALAKKQTLNEGRIFVVVGDGECQEGTTWESMLTAAHRKLDNLVIIVDYNKIQGSGFVEDILPIRDIGKIAEIIGWSVSEVNGHSNKDLIDVLNVKVKDKPRLIIAHTLKGKGVSYMEGKPEWHSKWPNPEQEKIALEELS
jgi:transketolase